MSEHARTVRSKRPSGADPVLEWLEQSVPDPLIGTTIGGAYRIEQHLATGGMARVYRGEHLRLGMPVAIKVLDCADECEALSRRFTREAMATAAMRCPHIVRVLDFGAMPTRGCFFVMELVPGVDLGALRRREGASLDPRRTLRILRQIAIAVDYAHARGIVHRDLKPENVMVDAEADDFVKLLDFGIARDMRASSSHGSYGEVLGTPEYMSPEQARGETVGTASDIWSLGVIALEMLTGRLPHAASSAARLIVAVAECAPRLPSALGLELPGLDRVFERALSRIPELRHPNAVALVDDLARVVSPERLSELPARHRAG